MPLLKTIRLNIRQKIVLGLLSMSMAMGVLAAVSFFNLQAMENKMSLVEFADDLSNTILEIRRSEKNYLLYGGQESLVENRDYSDKALAMLERVSDSILDADVADRLSRIGGLLKAYQMDLQQVVEAGGQADKELAVRDLRESGKRLIEQSKLLARIERDDIFAITKRLKRTLLYSAITLAVLAVVLFFFVTFKILLPLKVIEQTTIKIAEGNFETLPVWNTNDEIQRLMEGFNRMVHELESRQDQLVQAQKLSSIGTLASGIAHQLNNPLNNISTSCQILMEDDQLDKDFAEKMMRNISQETLRARDIVRGLLEFSRHQEFSLSRASLAYVVERSVNLISSQVPANIEIVTEVPEQLKLMMDTQRMQECFINLLINATQAIEDGQGRVGVHVQESEEPGRVTLVVEDTGKGIPREDLARIFDPFYTTKDVGSGTGLGLFIVYGIIKQHNGTIRVESEVGSGTRFLIDLPCEAEAATEEAR